jgi:hypothetical protein
MISNIHPSVRVPAMASEYIRATRAKLTAIMASGAALD